MVKRILFLTAIFSLFAMATSAQTMAAMNTRAKFKGIFIYRFAGTTEWPEAYKQGEFVIGVVGDDDLAKELETVSATKGINSQTVVVKRFKSPAEVTKCHLLYVGGSDIDAYITKAKQFKCLIVTEAPGALDKVAINFVIIAGQIKYEMNRKLFKDQGLTVGSELEKTATKVIN